MDIERFKHHVVTSLKNIDRARENPVSHDVEQVISDEKNFIATLYLNNHGEWDELSQLFGESTFRFFLSQIVKIEVYG